jgi:integrase
MSLGRDPATHKYITKSVNVPGPRRNAELKMSELMHQYNTTGIMDSTNLTVQDFLTQWLATVKNTLTPGAYERYESIIRVHLIPDFGDVLLNKLTPERIQNHYNQKLASGLSPLTVKYHHTVIHAALATAVRRGLLYRNAADMVDKPKGTRKEFQTWDENEVNQFLNSLAGGPYYTLFLVVLFTGMRRSELLGLRWSDIELLTGQVSVQRGLHQAKDRSYYYSEPKTAKSRRVIDLPPSVIIALSKHWETSKLPEGKKSLVFCTAKGKELRPNTISQIWSHCCKKAGVKVIRLHDARHTHATLLLKQGVHPKIVQERLGHSNIAMTLDTYSHVTPSMQKAAAQLFDDLITKQHLGGI